MTQQRKPPGLKSHQVFSGPLSPIAISNAIITVIGEEGEIQSLEMYMPTSSARAPGVIIGQ